MPSQLTYPGVYIEEVPSGVRTIVGVSTSVTAFVGRARRGAVDKPIVVTSFGEFERAFGGLWKLSRLGFSVRDFFLNGGSAAVIVRVVNDAANDADDPTASSVELGLDGDPALLTLEAVDVGLWGDSLRVRVDHDTRPHDADLGDEPDTLFNLTVRDGATGVIEMHRNVVLTPADHPRLLSRVLENESVLIRTAGTVPTAARPKVHTGTPAADETIWDDITPTPADPADEASQPFTGGDDGDDVVSADVRGSLGSKTGIYALEDADIVNILVIPPYKDVTPDGAGGEVETDVITEAARYAETRRAFYVVDAPPTWDSTADAKVGLSSLGTLSANAAVYFPRLKQTNPLRDNQIETFGASGAVAGVLARTDATRGVWKAPAGLEATLNGVPELSVPLTDGEIGQLNPLGINSLRAFAGAGRVIWGARTLRGADSLASEWKYIPVRRTALFIEESLFRGTQWVVFEPNDEPLWAQIRLNVGTFLNDLFRQGAFQGTTPREAYFVKCDRETTTQSDIDRGIVNIHVGFAPLKPAEFVVIRLQQIAGASAV
jgi:phage tail sheath protein FI